MHKQVLRLALPNIITNLTVPLLGMVDTAIVGHIPASQQSGDLLGGIAIGTMIFNVIYWNFGFLRMGTSGFTAQACGAKDNSECANILTRAVLIALISAFLLIALQVPIAWVASKVVEDKNGLMGLALQYFYVRIWAAPATLMIYSLKGFFIGMQNSKTPMWIAILINVLNIVFAFFFTFYLHWSIRGVALATVIAQWGGAVACWAFLFYKYGYLKPYFSLSQSLNGAKMRQFFNVNKDIFLRTLCIIAVTCYFTVASSYLPYPTLAVNTILMQLFTLFSYFMDGFAYSGESLCGLYYGAKDFAGLKKAIRYILFWGLVVSAAFTLAYLFFSRDILSIMTDKKDVLDGANTYLVWVCLIPFVSFVAFLYDGFLIGLTKSKIMRNSIFVATAAFFAMYFIFKTLWANDALWIAFLLYLLLRGVMMYCLYAKEQRKEERQLTNRA